MSSDSSDNILYRNGQAIPLQKEAEHFTAILPDKQTVEEIRKMEPVQDIKRVFRNVYKIRTLDYQLEDLMENMRRSKHLPSICHHAYAPEGDSATRYYITDKVIVQFKSGVSDTRIEDILAKCGLNLAKAYPGGRRFLLEVTKSTQKNPIKICLDLNEMPEVMYAEPNLVNRFQHFYVPMEELYPNQWHLNNPGGIELLAGADVGAPAAWDVTRGRRDIVVAVIDDGFDVSHPDLSGPGKIVFPKDFIDGDMAPLPEATVGDYHGTPCAGVAIGEENGSGIIGAAPGCSFMPIRFDLAADDHNLFEIFEYAGRRAHVLSCSWGPVPVFAPLSFLLYNQLTDLANTGGPDGKGCLIFFAAGNYNAPLKDMENESFKWRHPRRGLVETNGPILNGHATHPDVIAVAASTSQNRKAAYSNWGKEIDLCAPSNNWHPTDPMVKLPGRGIWTADNEGSGLGFEPGSRYTGNFGGTSSATPLAAGVAALVWSANPGLTAREVRKALEETADKITDPNPDPVLGLQKGIYDAQGHSEWFGFGKVNATQAVRAVAVITDPEPEPEPEPPVEEPEPIAEPPAKGALRVIAALVNPKGRESGAESVILLNLSDEPIALDDFSIADDRDRADDLTGKTIGANDVLKVTLSSARLSNSGGAIRLVYKTEKLLSEVKYSGSDASKEGWLVKF